MSKRPLKTPEFIVLFSLVTSLTAVSIDAILPALRQIGEALEVSDPNRTQLVVSMFILGMACGEVLFGPISDAVGRKRAILAGLLVFVVGTVVAMTAPSFEQFLAGRIIQGLGVSGPKIASRALIRDLYEGEAMARIMSLIFMVFVLVPMLAPALGQLVLFVADWRAIFVGYLVFAGVVAAWLGIRQPETLAPDRRIPFSLWPLFRNALLILGHGPVMAYTAAAGVIFGALLLYVGTAQAMFFDLYQVDTGFPLYFALLASAIGLAAFVNSRLVMRHGMHRLSVVALAGLVMSGCVLLALSFVYDGVPPFWAFMTSCYVMFFCIGMVFGNLGAMAMQSLARVAGLGASLVASVSSAIAVAMSVLTGLLYDQTAFALASGFVLAGALSLALVLVARKGQARAV